LLKLINAGEHPVQIDQFVRVTAVVAVMSPRTPGAEQLTGGANESGGLFAATSLCLDICSRQLVIAARDRSAGAMSE
jgi:hypothetical protein